MENTDKAIINELDVLETCWESADVLTMIFKQGGDIQIDDLSFIVTIALREGLSDEAIEQLDTAIGQTAELVDKEEEAVLVLNQTTINYASFNTRYTNLSEEDWRISYLELRKEYLQTLNNISSKEKQARIDLADDLKTHFETAMKKEKSINESSLLFLQQTLDWWSKKQQ